MTKYHVPIENTAAPLPQRWFFATYDVPTADDALASADADFKAHLAGEALILWAACRTLPTPEEMQDLREGFDRSGWKSAKTPRRAKPAHPVTLGKLREAFGGGLVYA